MRCELCVHEMDLDTDAMRIASTQRPKDGGALPIPPQPRFGTNEPEDTSKDEGNVEEEEEVGAVGGSGAAEEAFPSLSSTSEKLLGEKSSETDAGLPQRERKSKGKKGKQEEDSDYKWQLEKQAELQRLMAEREALQKAGAAVAGGEEAEGAAAGGAAREARACQDAGREESSPNAVAPEESAAGSAADDAERASATQGNFGDGKWGPEEVYTPAPGRRRRVSDLKSAEFGADAAAVEAPSEMAAVAEAPGASVAVADFSPATVAVPAREDFSEIEEVENVPAVNTKGVPMSRWTTEKSKRITAAVAAGPGAAGTAFAGRGQGPPAKTVHATGPLYSDGVARGAGAPSPARVFGAGRAGVPPAPARGGPTQAQGQAAGSPPPPQASQQEPDASVQMNGHASGAARQGSPIKAGAGGFDSPRRYSSPNRFKSPGKTGMDGMYGGHGTLLSNFSSAGVLCVWER